MTATLNQPLPLFLITLIISFVGSIQPGVVNTMALRLICTHGKRYALIYSAAACVPEIIYAFIAAYYVSTFHISNALQIIVAAFVGISLMVFGVFLLFNPPNGVVVNRRFDNPVLKGLCLSIANPQLVVFWSGMVIVYKEFGINIHGNTWAIVSFSIGAAVGAFLLLMGYIRLSDHFLNNFDAKKIIILNKISAYLLILLGIIAILGLIF